MKKPLATRFYSSVQIALVILVLLPAGLTAGHASPPANDDLANAQVIPPSASFSVPGNDAGATQESFEKASDYSLNFAKETIWYSWTPSVSGVFAATAKHPSNLDYSLIGLFKGPGTPSEASHVANSSIDTGVFPPVAVTAGQQYFILIANVAGSPFTLIGNVQESAPVVPVVTLSVKQAKAIRSTGLAGSALIELSSAPAADLKVDFKLAGTAVEGVDYKRLSDTVTVPAGATTTIIKIKPRSRDGEAAAAVKLTLVAGDGYTIGQPKQGVIKIVNKP